jgi:predicted DNA-binding protein YlxM (UPF0122 family)
MAPALTKSQVEEIKSTYLTGQYSMADLAFGYGVARSTVQAILEGVSWPELLDEGELENLAEVRASRRLYNNGN